VMSAEDGKGEIRLSQFCSQDTCNSDRWANVLQLPWFVYVRLIKMKNKNVHIMSIGVAGSVMVRFDVRGESLDQLSLTKQKVNDQEKCSKIKDEADSRSILCVILKERCPCF